MLNITDDEVIVTLHVRVPRENRDEFVDSINEQLNTLAREDVINDDDDSAWEWR